jgi:nucleotide-binding universal stress UspA family protein
MFRKILVPLDGSPLAEQALEPALRLAQAAVGELILMRVLTDADSHAHVKTAQDPIRFPESSALVHHASNAYLQRLREASIRPRLSVRTILGEGDRAGAIIDTALAEQVELIVMSTHGRTGLSRWVFGSVTSRVLSHAPCPILIIHKVSPIKHILITLDGSLLAEQALEPGLALAKVFGSKVTLLRVMTGPEVQSSKTTSPDGSESLANPRNEEMPAIQAERHLGDLIAIQETDRVIMSARVIFGQIASSILDYAAAQEVDLIAMTTHGRTGLRRWVYGSVTEKILYGTRKVVLVIRPLET